MSKTKKKKTINKAEKAQIAIEMLIYSGIFLVAFFFIYNLIYSYGQAQIKNSYYNTANEVMQRFVSVLNAVYSVGDGFSYSITLPKRIGDKDYFIYVINNNENVTTLILILDYAGYNISTANELKFPVRCRNICRTGQNNALYIAETNFNISVFYNITTMMNEVELKKG